MHPARSEPPYQRGTSPWLTWATPCPGCPRLWCTTIETASFLTKVIERSDSFALTYSISTLFEADQSFVLSSALDPVSQHWKSTARSKFLFSGSALPARNEHQLPHAKTRMCAVIKRAASAKSNASTTNSNCINLSGRCIPCITKDQAPLVNVPPSGRSGKDPRGNCHALPRTATCRRCMKSSVEEYVCRRTVRKTTLQSGWRPVQRLVLSDITRPATALRSPNDSPA